MRRRRVPSRPQLNAVRDVFVSEALSTVRRLEELLPELSDEEITLIIELEEGSKRRKAALDKLYREMRQRVKKEFLR